MSGRGGTSVPDEDDDLRVARLAAQGLVEPSATRPEEVVERLLAVQAQDLRAARLAVRARSTGLTAADVDDALTDRRSLVVGWLNRGTLHLVPAADWWWLHRLTGHRHATAVRRRLAQEGVSEEQAERGVGVVSEAVRSGGPRTRDQLREVLDEAGVPTAGQALVHVLFAASVEGLLVRGPVVEGQQAFADPVAWLGAPEPVDEDVALARLAEGYLVGHGPADARDLAAWSGLPLGACRRALALIPDRTAPWDDARLRLADAVGPPGASSSAGPGRPTASTMGRRRRASVLPAPRLLGGFDPILHGWADRSPFVGDHAGVVTVNGLFRPTALVEGRVVGTWKMDRHRVELTAFERITPTVRRALEAEVADVQRFLGLPVDGGITIVDPT